MRDAVKIKHGLSQDERCVNMMMYVQDTTNCSHKFCAGTPKTKHEQPSEQLGYLSSPGSYSSIVEEAETHGCVALSMMPRRPHNSHACCSFLPVTHPAT